MSIRCSAKALVISGEKVLLIRCQDAEGRVYFDLPGGGQRLYESMEETAKREVLEETGYTVEIDRFAALAEEIYENDALRRRYPEYTHRIYHIFFAHLTDSPRREPTETDLDQDACEWYALQEAASLPNVLPCGIENLFSGAQDAPCFLGTRRIQ